MAARDRGGAGSASLYLPDLGGVRALDLFCGAGGASRGLADAGFEVTGVDIEPQPRYPYQFRQADALWVLTAHPLEGFDFIWASPPCQRHSTMTHQTGNPDDWPDLIDETRQGLLRAGVPYVIENVPGAMRQLHDPIMLCGSMFDLGVVRHRYFECSFPVGDRPTHKHRGSLVTGEYVTVTGNGGVPAWTLKEREKRGLPRHNPGEYSLENWSQAMGIDWMTREELVQAIPPAYSRFIAEALVR